MNTGFQFRRLLAMGFLMLVAFVCLGYRLVDLQVIRHDELREESEDATRAMFLRAPKRGEIRDIRGNLLAGSIIVKTVCGNPAVVGERRGEVARLIAPLLQMSEREIYQKLEPIVRTNLQGRLTTNKYVVLNKKVPVETWQKIQAAMKQVPLGVKLSSLPRRERDAFSHLQKNGVFAESAELRVYPNRSLAAHVLGMAGTGTAETPVGRINQLEGKDGVELILNTALTGVVGWRSTEMASRRELVAFRNQDIEAHPGRNVVLTLDAGVQHILETELARTLEKHTPISASGVVVRPRTGEILAMATLPSFDPNDLARSVPELRRNRVITDTIEPGSTFKIVVVSGALNDGIISLHDKFDCEQGVFVFGGRRLRDHNRYGLLSVEEIITHSSNIGCAKIGMKLGAERLHRYMLEFGFGSRTGIPLAGEVPGTVHPLKRWTKLSISRVPMGHEVAVTPLQMTMAMAAVANEGRLMRPMLVDRLEDEQGRVIFKNYPHVVREVVDEQAARLMTAALKTVVSTNGTGRKAIMEHYTVAGKTGTTQKLVGGQYRRDKHFSSFVGFFPADQPELCIGIFVDEPKNGYYGGEAAAPIFRQIAERLGQYLAIPADVAAATPLVAGGSTGTAAPNANRN